MNIFEKLACEIDARRNRKAIEMLHGRMESIDIVEYLGMKSGSIKQYDNYYPQHPKFAEHVAACKTKISEYRASHQPAADGKYHVTISLGDSIVALSEKVLSSEIDLNFNLPGDSGMGFVRVYDAIALDLQDFCVDFLVIGCWVGNGLLNGQTYQAALKEFDDTWGNIRKRLPGAKIITYGIPATFNLYASSVRFDFNFRVLLQKVYSDGNATATLLQRGYAGVLGLFPTIEMSYDTVHLTSRGQYRLRDDIRAGKKSIPGTVMN
jgi:hypothetical protein